MWETYWLNWLNRHGHHSNTTSSEIVPDPDDGVFTILCWSNQITLHVDIEAANWGWMAEEESSLKVSLSIHSNQSTTWTEQDYIFSFISWPFEVSAHVWLESNYMLKFHYWVLIQLMRSWELIATILPRDIVWCPRGIWLLLYTSTWSNRWLGFIIIFDDIATYWMVSWCLVELHIELPLHVSILLLLSCDCASLFYINSINFLLNILSKETVDLLSHLLSRSFDVWLDWWVPVFLNQVLKIHIFISIRSFAVWPVMRKALPIEIFHPFT